MKRKQFDNSLKVLTKQELKATNCFQTKNLKKHQWTQKFENHL